MSLVVERFKAPNVSRYDSYALAAAPGEQWASLDNALDISANPESFQRALGNAIVDRANAAEKGRLHLIGDYGPGAAGQEMDYGRYAADYDTILELCVAKIGFRSFGGAEPKYDFYMNAEMKLIGTAGNTVMFRDLFTCTGDSESASRWLSDDALKLRREMVKGIDHMSWQIGLLLSPAS